MKNKTTFCAVLVVLSFMSALHLADWHIGFPPQPKVQLADWHIGFPPQPKLV